MKIDSDFIKDINAIELTFVCRTKYEEDIFITKSGNVSSEYDNSGRRVCVKVTDKNGQKMYILGFEHLTFQVAFQLSFTLEEAIKTSKLVLDLDTLNDLYKLGIK